MDECHGCVNLKLVNDKLQACIDPLSEQYLKDDDQKVQFYTGLLTFSMLIFIAQFVSHGKPLMGKLNPFQDILLVLMNLRLNLEEQDLAYRFVCHNQLFLMCLGNGFIPWQNSSVS